jgi:sugar lactone lactonase YvrE
MKGIEMSLNLPFSSGSGHRLRATVVCAVAALTLAACGGGGGGGTQATDSTDVRGTVAGLTVGGLVLTNGTDSVTLSANATSFTLPAGGTLAVTKQPLGFAKFCELGGSNAAPTLACSDAAAAVFDDESIGSGTWDTTYGVAVTSEGITYVSDVAARVIYKITADGAVSVFAGSGDSGSSDSDTGTNATFTSPRGLAVDGGGHLYVADGCTIRKIDTAGAVTTIAGASDSCGTDDGELLQATLNSLQDIAVDASGNVYFTQLSNRLVRKLGTDGVVVTMAGPSGLSLLAGIAVDASGVVYVSNYAQHQILKITTSGGNSPVYTVTPIAGQANLPGTQDSSAGAALTSATFTFPIGITVDSAGNLYVAQQGYGDQRGEGAVRLITPDGQVRTLVGTDAFGLQDGVGANVQFSNPAGIAMTRSGELLVVDQFNKLLRKVKPVKALVF